MVLLEKLISKPEFKIKRNLVMNVLDELYLNASRN